MDKVAEQLPAIITAAAQSNLGIMALLSVALAVLAYFFFANASEKVKVGIFVILFLGVVGFGTAMFQAAKAAPAAAEASTHSSSDPLASLSREARHLLKEAASDRAGVVTYVHYGMGSELTTNNKNLLRIEERDPRALAAWEDALRQLVGQGMLTDPGPQGEVFRVTSKGYGVAERISGLPAE